MKIGLVGFGYWGKKLAKAIVGSDYFSLSYIVEPRESAFQQTDIPVGASTSATLDPLCQDRQVSHVIVASPPDTHFAIVKKLLIANKTVLVEKPFCRNLGEAADLVSLAERRNLGLMIDYTYLHTGSIQRIRELTAHRPFELFESLRMSMGLVREDVGIIEDLMSHDISIVVDLADTKNIRVRCEVFKDDSASPVRGYAVLEGESWKATLQTSCRFPKKIRLISFHCGKDCYLYDEMNREFPLMHWEAQPHQLNSPKPIETDPKEALLNVLEHFRKLEKYDDCREELEKTLKIHAILAGLKKSAASGGQWCSL